MSRKLRASQLQHLRTHSSQVDGALAAAASARIQELEDALYIAKKQAQRWKRIATARKEELTTITRAQQTFKGTAQRFLTVAAGMRMACQRNSSHVSCKGLVDTHGLDLDEKKQSHTGQSGLLRRCCRRPSISTKVYVVAAATIISF